MIIPSLLASIIVMLNSIIIQILLRSFDTIHEQSWLLTHIWLLIIVYAPGQVNIPQFMHCYSYYERKFVVLSLRGAAGLAMHSVPSVH